MSYEIIKSITIKGKKVFVISASNNVYPRTFERWEPDAFNKVYQEGGLEALLLYVAANTWEGNFHIHKGSKLCNLLSEAFDGLSKGRNAVLRHFLDTDRAAKYMTSLVLFRMGKWTAPPSLSELHSLRDDKAAVLDICSKNPSAFDYASERIRKDRDAAKAHIIANADKVMFNMPFYFRADKELAALALEKAGTNFRQLDPSIRSEKDLIKLAFDSSLNRPFFEHLPDLIPASVRRDIPFMKEVISSCPKMHFFRTPDLMEHKELVKAFFETGCWSPYQVRNIPVQHLNDPDIQNIIRNTMENNPEVLKTAFKSAEKLLAQHGAIVRKQPLGQILQAAETKAQCNSPAHHHEDRLSTINSPDR